MKKSLLYFFLLTAFGANAQNYSLGLLGSSSQHVDIGTGAAITGTAGFTVEAWVKTTATSDATLIQQREPGPVGYEGEYVVSLTTSGQIFWLIQNGGAGFSLVSNGSVNDGKWHHIAVTREADHSGRIYIDGILDQSGAGTSCNMLPLFVTIGYDFRDGDKFYTGDIEEVRIWNTARTAFQIKEFAFKTPANNAAGLVAYYKTNENGGTSLVNSSTNTSGIDGTIVNSATWTSSQVFFGNNAMNFDGVNDVVTSSGNINNLAAFTIEGWVYTTSEATGVSFFGQNDAIEFGFSSPTSVGGWTGNVAGIGGVNQVDWTFAPGFFLNTWRHVAFTGDGANIRLYVDGILRATAINSAPDYGSSGFPVTIGGEVWGPATGYLPGNIDEVRIWNVARTQPQIQGAMLTELNAATQTGLIAYYTFNQGVAAGTNTLLPKLFDLSGNTFGDLSAFALNGPTTNFVAQNPGFASLPLNWISFTASKQAQRVVLNWSTAAEEETKDFVVEQSADGVSWHQIGTELAKNRSTVNNYQFVHNFPDKTLNFYRILQRDQNGRSVYSKTISVRFAGLSRPVIYSNPVSNGTLSLRMENAGTVQLYNAQGLLVINKQLNAGMQSINVSTLAAGVYLLKTNESTERVIIQ